jgi:hypothetical protein
VLWTFNAGAGVARRHPTPSAASSTSWSRRRRVQLDFKRGNSIIAFTLD